MSFSETILWKISQYIKQNWNSPFSSEISGVSGMLFSFSFSTIKIISKSLSLKSSSVCWVSDESDKFFSTHFVKKYTDISSKIGIVLSVLRLMAWVAWFFIFCFSNTNNCHFQKIQESFQMQPWWCRTENSLAVLNYLFNFSLTVFTDDTDVKWVLRIR